MVTAAKQGAARPRFSSAMANFLQVQDLRPLSSPAVAVIPLDIDGFGRLEAVHRLLLARFTTVQSTRHQIDPPAANAGAPYVQARSMVRATALPNRTLLAPCFRLAERAATSGKPPPRVMLSWGCCGMPAR